MIYALLDRDTLEKYQLSISDFILRAEKVGASLLQYRDKNASLETKWQRLEEIRKLWKRVLIVNDDVSLIDLADGVHIGQEDLLHYGSIESIRERVKEKFIGLSTHNEEEIDQANRLDIDYIGLGAYRKTVTKETKNELGKTLSDLAKASLHPVAAIGGVRLDDSIACVDYRVIGTDICKSVSIP